MKGPRGMRICGEGMPHQANVGRPVVVVAHSLLQHHNVWPSLPNLCAQDRFRVQGSERVPGSAFGQKGSGKRVGSGSGFRHKGMRSANEPKGRGPARWSAFSSNRVQAQ